MSALPIPTLPDTGGEPQAFLLSESGVTPIRTNVRMSARMAVQQGNLVVTPDGVPVEKPIQGKE